MSSMQVFTDSELVARSIKGDKQAFGLLYERHLDQIYRYIFYRVSDHAIAEDLTQMVFIKAWEKLPVASKQKEIQNIRAWIYRIAHNSVVDFYRTNKPATPLEQLNIIRDDSPGPEAVIQENEADLHLAQTISLLDGNLRQVIILRFVNRLSHEEVAQIMGLSESHVRVLQYRALKKMRNQLLERNGHDE